MDPDLLREYFDGPTDSPATCGAGSRWAVGCGRWPMPELADVLGAGDTTGGHVNVVAGAKPDGTTHERPPPKARAA